MHPLLEFLLKAVSQFAGGTGSMENNLVRFSIPAATYLVLLAVAWTRQREFHLPREKLLVWGFGLGSASALTMLLFVVLQMTGVIQRQAAYPYLVPVERALEVASIGVVAGAFLLYILDDRRLAYAFVWAVLGLTLSALFFALWQWPRYYAALTEAQFHTAWVSYLFEVISTTFLISAMIALRKQRGWLPRTVSLALFFYLLGEVFLLINYATNKQYDFLICPFGNSFPILAIPLLAYVYLHEQDLWTRRANRDLQKYRDHLEELVMERTAEIAAVNDQLHTEVRERMQAEAEIARRNADLAAQNEIGAALSSTLDLETILNHALDAVLSIVRLEAGLVYLWDAARGELVLKSYRGSIFQGDVPDIRPHWSCCESTSLDALRSQQAVVISTMDCPSRPPAVPEGQQAFDLLVCVPLVSNGKAVGALTLASRYDTAVQPHQMELLTVIGQQVGMAIENASLYQQAEQSARELALLHEASLQLASTLDAARIYEQIAAQSVRLLDCPLACVLDWDAEAQHARLLASQGIDGVDWEQLLNQPDTAGCVKALVYSSSTLAVEDARGDLRVPAGWSEALQIGPLMCVPIRGMNEPFGALILMDRSAARRWRAAEMVLIESFVNRAAVALMNASLSKQLEWAAALEERQRIAADMHDGLAQTVSLLGLQIEGAMELVEDGARQEAVTDLVRARETVEHVSVEVRRSIASLKGAPQPRRSLQDLLAGLPENLSCENPLPVDFDFQLADPVYLPAEQGNQVVYVVQEAMVNANRHARARHIRLLLARRAGELEIAVEDDGVGFEMGEWWKHSQEHFGLSIMHSRAARAGARLQLQSAPGQGTRVALVLPFHAFNPSRNPGTSPLSAPLEMKPVEGRTP